MQFDPRELVVHKGDRVIWSNKDLLPHSARADSGSFSSDLIEPNASWTWVANRPGTYPYGCVYHPGMRASVRVLAVNLPLTADNDNTIVRQIVCGDTAAFARLMRQYNQRLFRLARATLRDDAEAEDALQDAYLAAYRGMEQFRGERHCPPGCPGSC